MISTLGVETMGSYRYLPTTVAEGELGCQVVSSVPNAPRSIHNWTYGGVATTERSIIVVLRGYKARNCKTGCSPSAHYGGNRGRQYDSGTPFRYQAKPSRRPTKKA
ncbi:hypothetical protein FA95DRAFT_225395 [Auriscalpium vulgare]|uniref:Uncharacterized protein n=1 Tax=Auriscalpium vulgare TaxID=40419 RepID=A0ACB8RKE9_9AGAM|nr:hypothetical protein FA95DRAFT_225395 [Auriscalpium vulgare]